MNKAARQLSALVDSLHSGIFEGKPWLEFLALLRDQTGARYASLTFRPSDREEVVEYFSGDGPSPAIGRKFFEKFYRDPLPHREMKEGRVYSLDELMHPDDPVQIAFYNEIMLPTQMRHVRTVRVREPTGAEAWLSFTGPRDFARSGTDLTKVLVPHLRTALRGFVTMEQEQFRSSVTRDAMHRMNFGWMTLDQHCRIIDVDPHAERLIVDSTVLRRTPNGRISLSRSEGNRQFVEAVASIGTAPESSQPRAINVSTDPWMGMLIAPIRNPPVSANPKPAVIIYVNGDRRSSADRCEQLVNLFGLLPSEARLAWAMAQGQSIVEASRSLDITRETARSYAKKIYAKLGARGQTDVVRMILTSVLTIA